MRRSKRRFLESMGIGVSRAVKLRRAAYAERRSFRRSARYRAVAFVDRMFALLRGGLMRADEEIDRMAREHIGIPLPQPIGADHFLAAGAWIPRGSFVEVGADGAVVPLPQPIGERVLTAARMLDDPVVADLTKFADRIVADGPGREPNAYRFEFVPPPPDSAEAIDRERMAGIQREVMSALMPSTAGAYALAEQGSRALAESQTSMIRAAYAPWKVQREVEKIEAVAMERAVIDEDDRERRIVEEEGQFRPALRQAVRDVFAEAESLRAQGKSDAEICAAIMHHDDGTPIR